MADQFKALPDSARKLQFTLFSVISIRLLMRASSPNDLISDDVFSDTTVILWTFSTLCRDLFGEDEYVSYSNHDQWLYSFFSRSTHLCSW